MSRQYDADWTDAAQRYQSTVGAVSAGAATELVRMATILGPFAEDSATLDIGCGPGAVTLAVLAQEPTAQIEAIDTSSQMLDDLAANISTSGLSAPGLTAKTVDIHDIATTYTEASFSHVFASFVLHIATPDFAGRVADIYRVLRPGGVLGIATFTPHTEPYIIWDRVCRIFDPQYEQASYAVDSRAWASPGQVAGGMQTTGFGEIKCVLRRTPFPIHTADGWAEFWFGGKNPAAEAVIRPFFETHDVSVAEVKDTYTRVVKEEWNGGENVLVEYVLAVGRKPL